MVGRIPANSTSTPRSLATDRTRPRSSFNCASMALKQLPPKPCGSRLSSRLKAPTSVTKCGSSTASRISNATGAGFQLRSTRNISCSAPMRRTPDSMRSSASMRSRACTSRSRAWVNCRRSCPAPLASATSFPLARVLATDHRTRPTGTRRGTAGACAARSASRGATPGPTSRPGWGCLATELVGDTPRLADVLVRALAAGEHDEAGAQHLEQCAILVEVGRKCSGEAARKLSSTGPSTKPRAGRTCHSCRSRRGTRRASGTARPSALNAPIEAPDVMISMSGDSQSARIAGTTS